MYDILQLNDMLVPELLDIAEQLKISQAKKMDKQALIYKILDAQAISASEVKGTDADKGKRKRIVKATTANSTEEAIVESEEKPVRNESRKVVVKKEDPVAKEEKPVVKRGRKKADDKATELPGLAEPGINSTVATEPDSPAAAPETPAQAPQGAAEPQQSQQPRPPFQNQPRREPREVFNIEFDGIIPAKAYLK